MATPEGRRGLEMFIIPLFYDFCRSPLDFPEQSD
jgi:hypothetical protein